MAHRTATATMFNSPTAEDEWVLMFVSEMLSLNYPEEQGVIAMLARRLHSAMGHLPPHYAARTAYALLIGEKRAS